MPIMQEAVKIVYDMSADAKVRELARWREKVLLDKESALDEARTEGLEIGEAQAIINNVNTLMTTTKKPLEEVLGLLQISQGKYQSCLELLQNNNE